METNNVLASKLIGVFVSWRFTTLAKLSVDVSDVVSHTLSGNGPSVTYQALN